MPVVDRNESYCERRKIQVDLWMLEMFEIPALKEDCAAAAGRGGSCEDRPRKRVTLAKMQNGQLNGIRVRPRGIGPARL